MRYLQPSVNKREWSYRVARLRLSTMLLLSLPMLSAYLPLSGQSLGGDSDLVQDRVSASKHREHPVIPSSGELLTRTIDPDAVQWFANELQSSEAKRRLDIVELLVDLSRRLEPSLTDYTFELHNHAILALLTGPALEKADSARDTAMAALRHWGTQAALNASAEHFCEVTLASPSPEGFLLLAKAKPISCRQALEKLALSREWKDDNAARILLAALGDTNLEDQFLAFAINTESSLNSECLAKALENLALIGTMRSLNAVAQRLRTPLSRIEESGFRQSVRMDALRGLSYNYPGVADFSPEYIDAKGNYPYAEAFCNKILGAQYQSMN